MTERDVLEVEALVTDRYLESLLARREQPPTGAASDPELDSGVRVAAHALEAQLVRVHPSFRFEERLAADLQAAGTRQRRGGRVGRPGAIRRIEPRLAPSARGLHPMPIRTLPGAAPAPSGTPMSRPLLIGGALTSAAISIAGAYVAWRRGHPPLDPMVRAVRAAHRAGLSRRIPARAPRLAIPRGTRTR
jgi:hypothetical protein